MKNYHVRLVSDKFLMIKVVFLYHIYYSRALSCTKLGSLRLFTRHFRCCIHHVLFPQYGAPCYDVSIRYTVWAKEAVAVNEFMFYFTFIIGFFVLHLIYDETAISLINNCSCIVQFNRTKYNFVTLSVHPADTLIRL